MISIKEYAKKNNVSYEAIRQQVKRYENELNGHIFKKNRTQFLDETAEKILDQHRKESPLVIINEERDDRIKQLEEENRNLLLKIAEQANKISELAEWKSEHAVQIAEANSNKKLLEVSEREKNSLVMQIEHLNQSYEMLNDDLNKTKSELAITKEELEKEHNKGFFARLFNK